MALTHHALKQEVFMLSGVRTGQNCHHHFCSSIHLRGHLCICASSACLLMKRVMQRLHMTIWSGTTRPPVPILPVSSPADAVQPAPHSVGGAVTGQAIHGGQQAAGQGRGRTAPPPSATGCYAVWRVNGLCLRPRRMCTVFHCFSTSFSSGFSSGFGSDLAWNGANDA